MFHQETNSPSCQQNLFHGSRCQIRGIAKLQTPITDTHPFILGAVSMYHIGTATVAMPTAPHQFSLYTRAVLVLRLVRTVYGNFRYEFYKYYLQEQNHSENYLMCERLFDSCSKLRKRQTTLVVLSHGTQTRNVMWWQKMDLTNAQTKNHKI